MNEFLSSGKFIVMYSQYAHIIQIHCVIGTIEFRFVFIDMNHVKQLVRSINRINISLLSSNE